MKKIEDLINNLRKYREDLKRFEVPVQPDDEGFIDLECPKKECLLEFKIHSDNASELFHRKLIYCPRCKNKSRGDQYYPSALLNQTREQLVKHLRSALFEGRRMPKTLIPFESKESWRQKIECEECHTKYSVIGVAFFCPFCGHNSVDRSFEDSMKIIQIKVNFNADKTKAISLGLNDDDVEMVVKTLTETCLTDCVTAFEDYCKYYYKIKSGEDPKRNIFQRIHDGSKQWKSLLLVGYEDWISTKDLTLLTKLFQQRHLFIHNKGVVDQEYIDKSGDKNYTIGQRIVVMKTEINKLTEILIILANEIKTHCV